MSITEQLKEPFDPKVVHWRVGATNAKELNCKPWEATIGIALAYIDARDVMKRLDDVLGDDWQARAPYKGYCEVGVKIDGEWLWRGNSAGETDVEGEKGQASDAFKRAAVLWGVGRYLYYLPNQWYPLEKGKLVGDPKLPDWAKPDLNRFKPNEKKEIISQVKDCLDAGDSSGVIQIYNEYKGGPQEQKFWALFNSTERSTMKTYLEEK